MAENAGTIYYDVDINTQGAIEAQREVKASTQSINSSLESITSSSNKASTAIEKTGAAAKSGGTALAGVGKKAGAASIQVQQFVGQVQGGVNPMIALSQQAADLGIVLGLPLLGSVVGIAAAFAGPFITSIFDAEKQIETFNEKIDDTISGLKSTRQEIAQGAIDILKTRISETTTEIERLGTADASRSRSIVGRQQRRIENEEKSLELLRQRKKDIEALTVLEKQLADISSEKTDEQKKAEDEISKRANLAQRIIAQQQAQFQDEQTLADEQLQVRLAAIGEARQQQLDIGQTYDQAEYEARALHAERLAALDEQRTNAEKAEAANRIALRQAELAAYTQLFGQLNSVALAAGKEQTILGKAIFAANQALAIGNILVNTYANASKYTGTPLYNTVLSLGFATAGAAAGVAIKQTTNRQTGGPVQAGSAYRVNEAGAEGYKFSSAGREYIQMLGGNGEIVPADKMGGSGVQVSVTVNNGSGVGANVSSSDDGKYITIDTFRTDMAENGPMSRSMTGAFSGLKRRTE